MAHAARRRLADWLGLRAGATESHLGLLMLVETSLQLAPPSVPKVVVLYLWAQGGGAGAAPPRVDKITAAPALPLGPGPAAGEAEPERAEEDSSQEAIVLAGAELIRTAASATGDDGAEQGRRGERVKLPGEADSEEVATVGQALEACLVAMERLQAATAGSAAPLRFDGRITRTANFLRDVGLHQL